MSKRPNLKEIGLKIVKGEGELHADHPVHHLSANEGFLFLPISLLRPDPDQPGSISMTHHSLTSRHQ
jgi:hypothetical protein